MSQYQSIVDAEWDIINEKMAACASSGANIILSKLPIGDLATQYFADRGLFCAGRVPRDDLERVARATGARVQTTVNGLSPDVLGTCESFEEKQVGTERFNIFTGFVNTAHHTATVVLRGGSEQFIDEAERSIHDALMIVKSSIRSHSRVVAGAWAALLRRAPGRPVVRAACCPLPPRALPYQPLPPPLPPGVMQAAAPSSWRCRAT